MKPGIGKRKHSTFLSYAATLVAVVAAGLVRVVLLHERPGIVAPFFAFYPVIALAAFLGGVGTGIAATVATAVFVAAMFSHRPPLANWIWLCIVATFLIWSFSRLKRLRHRSATLAEESRKLRLVVDRVSDWIFLTSETGVIQYANQTASNNLGVPVDQLIGRPIEDLTSGAQKETIRDLLAKCRDQATPPTEILFQRRDNTPVSVEIGCTAISAEDTRVIHVAGRDITERKAIDRKLGEARQFEGLGVLAGGIAHEFNNLLTSIMGNASLAKEGIPGDNPVTGLLESIETASERSADLVRLMLATSGYRPRFREALRVDKLLQKILAERPLSSGVSVKAVTEHAEFESDGRSIETLLWSLISNAAESYGNAGGEVSVAIRSTTATASTSDSSTRPDFEDGALPSGACVEIVVEDSGCGMTPEVLERVFDPFFTTKFTGRGLGLPAVRGIVRAHGGRLVIRTRPRQGTRVAVWLPCASYHVNTSA